MSGSADKRQDGLYLIVPAIALVIPAIVLICGLLMLSAATTVAAVPIVSTTQADLASPSVDEPEADLVAVADAPPDDLAMVAPRIAAIETPIPPTPAAPPPTLAPTPTPRESWTGPPTFTFVALGVDQRNEKEIPRTDTIMIGRVDLRVPRVNLVSIPRDLFVEIPGYGKDRINTAYVYGEQYKEPGGGIGLLERTIEKNFGVQIDHFGLVDFQCFRTAVDAVGGVTVNVPRAILDPNYPTDDYGTKEVKFEVGRQKMDGERALEYARTRYADNDFQRMQRQQLIISAMREQFLQLRTLPALPTLIGGCRNMRSDLGWRDYLTLATTLQSLDSSRVSFAAIDENMAIGTVLPSGAQVLMPRWEPIRATIGETFGLPGSGTRAGVTGSPGPVMAAPSPSPLPPFAAPSPSPLPGSVAGPWPGDVLPGDAPGVAAPPALPARQS